MIRRTGNLRQFTVIENDVIDDDRLSYRALGLLTYIQSLPDGAEVDLPDLIGEGREDLEQVNEALTELKNSHYLSRMTGGSVE